MRYFRAFYTSEENIPKLDDLQAVHIEFDDKVFVLPYRRGGWSEESPERFCSVLIAKDGSMDESVARKYLDRTLRIWGLENDLVQTRIEECTIEGCFLDDIYRFSSCSFDESQIKGQLKLNSAYSFASRAGRGLQEYIVGAPLDKSVAMDLASDSAYACDLREEVENIFDTHGDADLAFAPISYIVEGNAPSDSDEAINILLRSMMGAGRLCSRHIFTIDVDSYTRWPSRDMDADRSTMINHQLIRAIEGNVLVIRYGAYENHGDYDVEAYALFAKLIDLIEDAECRTQVIFSVPEAKRDMVMRLRKRFNKPFVIIGKNVGTDVGSATYESNLDHLKKMAEAAGKTPDDSMATLLSKRMREKRALELEDIFDEWATYHDARRAFPQYADVIDEAIELDGCDAASSALDRLDALIGLDDVKEHIRNIILRVEMGQKMMERGIPMKPFSMNMAFLGAPGTGKTEVARLYAEILKDMGILSEGRLISISGGSGFDVKRTFERARGSVLFVDEAYGMLSSPTSITEFIAQMENNRNDTVVILAGYEGHIRSLLDCNPGFRSRVQTMIEFADYTSDELRRIFAFMCESSDLIMGAGVDEAVRDLLERGGKRCDQGNARYVRKVYEDAVGAQQIRLAKRMKGSPDAELDLDELRTLQLEDMNEAAKRVGGIRAQAARSAREELSELIGLDEVKKLVSARMDFAKMQKVKRDAGLEVPFVPMHMAFKGNPGTGKTEVARLIGRMLREEGVLSVGDFYECGRQDLVSPFMGGSAPRVEALFNEARGSVIFIDEAYSLIDGAKGGPSDEAINALIDQMEKLRDEVVVIFAGYTKEIDDLLSTNPGFRSRVKTQIEFPDYTADQLIEILHHMAGKQGYGLSDGVDAKVREMAASAMRDSEFGNARFVRNLFENALVEQSVRLAADLDGAKAPSVGSAKTVVSETRLTELTTLLPEDFVWESAQKPVVSIGFAA